jgi:hypothetical protein
MDALTRRKLLLGAALPFGLPEGERLRITNRAFGWTVLRDREAVAGAQETGMVLVRVRRPVAPADRPGHLAASLRHFRPFHFGPLPAEEPVRVAGLPGRAIEAPAMGIGSRIPVMVRAVCLFGRDRSFLIIGSAPVAEWAAIRPEVLRLIEGFRPG